MTTLARATGTWRKSSRSNNGNNGCIEFGCLSAGRPDAIRDSKGDLSKVLRFSEAGVAMFIGWAVINWAESDGEPA